jgi:hypothetical protein
MFLLVILFITKYYYLNDIELMTGCQFASAYIKELNWGHDFASELPALLEIADQTPLWHSSENNKEQFCIIKAIDLLKIDIFKKINSELLKHQIRVSIGILRKIKPLETTAIHTDWPGLYTALNIPLLNSTSAVTSWYNFDNNSELSSLETVAFKLPADSPLCMITDQDRDRLLKFKIFEFTMSKPVLFNTSIPHNVQSINNVERIILSLQFKKNIVYDLDWADNALFENLQLV